MPTQPQQSWWDTSPFRWSRNAVLAAAAACLLAAVPAATAGATTPSITPIEASQVTSLLNQTPLASLPTAELTGALEGVPQLEGIEAATVQAALTEAIEALKGEGANVGELLGSSGAVTQLVASLTEALGPLAGLIETLLGGNPAAKLTEALGSLNSSDLLDTILGSSAEPERAIEGLLGSLNPAELESLFGSSFAGTPWIRLTVNELAAQLGISVEKLAEDLGIAALDLPGTATALTAPLTDGKTLGLLDGLGGVNLALLGDSIEKTSGSGEDGGSGATNITSSTPASTSTTKPAASTATAPAKKSTPIRVIRRSVKGDNVSIEVAVPAAGKVWIEGRGIKAVHRECAKAMTATLHTTLTRARAAAFHKHPHRKVPTTIKVGFKQAGGPASSASIRIAFG
jgi:hypothetical protein